jgi:hypothetical protein
LVAVRSGSGRFVSHWIYKSKLKYDNVLKPLWLYIYIASSVVDRGFEPRSVKPKTIKFGIWCISDKRAALRRKRKDWLVGIRIMCLSGTPCLSADCCFNKQAWLSSIQKNGPQHHHLIEHQCQSIFRILDRQAYIP